MYKFDTTNSANLLANIEQACLDQSMSQSSPISGLKFNVYLDELTYQTLTSYILRYQTLHSKQGIHEWVTYITLQGAVLVFYMSKGLQQGNMDIVINN